MNIIVRDIVDGISALTAARVVHYQLPVDREQLPTFALNEYMTARLATLSEDMLPDYVVLDTSGSRTHDFDTYSQMSSVPFPCTTETQLPVSFSISCANGTTEHYEAVSFCNFERSGISRYPTYFSRAVGLLRWFSGKFIVPAHAFPVRHATAVVRYADQWYVAEDTCIWQVHADEGSSLDVGQALLRQYPGMRIVVIYKKADTSYVNNDHAVDLVLTKVSPSCPVPLLERPELHLWTAFMSLILFISIMYMFLAAWRASSQWAWWVRRSFRSIIFVIWLTASLPFLGGLVSGITNARVLYRKAASTITLAADDEHMSGLYSSSVKVQR